VFSPLFESIGFCERDFSLTDDMVLKLYSSIQLVPKRDRKERNKLFKITMIKLCVVLVENMFLYRTNERCIIKNGEK
jgi:hypothetical protein